jgi:hypothetical protein
MPLVSALRGPVAACVSSRVAWSGCISPVDYSKFYSASSDVAGSGTLVAVSSRPTVLGGPNALFRVASAEVVAVFGLLGLGVV